MRLLYLNANILYGECLKQIEGRRWKRSIKTGVCKSLNKQGNCLFTSILTKLEIVQRLVREENCSLTQARSLYELILNTFDITQISSLNKLNLMTNTFVDIVLSSNLDFKDALHLTIASRRNLTIVTHDKKFRQGYSQHRDKLKFYSEVCKPEDLLDN